MIEKPNDSQARRADVPGSTDAATEDALRLRGQLEEVRNQLELERRYSGFAVMQDLVPILENLERGILAGRHTGDFDALMESVKVVRQTLYDVLAKHGLNEIEGVLNAFDERLHQQVSEKTSDGIPHGSIVRVVQRGYRVHDRVLRRSKVVVAGPKMDSSSS